MTWTAVGILNPSSNAGTTFSFTPAGVGHMVGIEVCQFSDSVVAATALSSTNMSWSLVGSQLGTNTPFAGTAALFIGTVLAASAATVTVTWSGSAPASTIITGQEFASTVGSWLVDTSQALNSAGTNAWPVLAPAVSGELYLGYALDSGAAVRGATSGYTYQLDGGPNGYAYNLNVSAASGPTWGDSGQCLGVMALIKEVGAPTSGPPYATRFIQQAATVPFRAGPVS